MLSFIYCFGKDSKYERREAERTCNRNWAKGVALVCSYLQYNCVPLQYLFNIVNTSMASFSPHSNMLKFNKCANHARLLSVFVISVHGKTPRAKSEINWNLDQMVKQSSDRGAETAASVDTCA